MNKAVVWQEVVILLFGALGGAATSGLIRDLKYTSVEVGGIWMCHDPNRLGRLECLVMPEGAVILIPKQAPKQEPTTAEAK